MSLLNLCNLVMFKFFESVRLGADTSPLETNTLLLHCKFIDGARRQVKGQNEQALT